MNFDERVKFLGAPSTEALTKTIIMVNSHYREEQKDDPHYHKYVVVVIQFIREINAGKLASAMKKYQNSFY